LNTFDSQFLYPGHVAITWRRGEDYTAPTPIPVFPGTFAVVARPEDGVILYKICETRATPQGIVFGVAALTTAVLVALIGLSIGRNSGTGVPVS
jgi:hypothetical protein